MTWKYVDLGTGITWEVVEKFITDKKYESTLIMDLDGTKPLDVKTICTQIKN